MTQIIEWIKYPIKLLLQKKVKRYRLLLLQAKERATINPLKFRRKGMSQIVADFQMHNLQLEIKYLNFIKKWEL